MELTKSIVFAAGFTFFYHDILDTVETRPKIFASSVTNESEYDHWTFSTDLLWDSFYYAETSELLVNGHIFKIGETNLLQT